MCLLAYKNDWFVAEENIHAYKAVFVQKEETQAKWRGIAADVDKSMQKLS